MGIPEQVRHQLHLLPSILSADFVRLGEQVTLVMDAGARIIHVDVMDGHFVPNISVGIPVLRALAPLVHRRGGYCSVHLMIERPEKYIEAFVEAGADALSIHVEACAQPFHALQAIRDLGAAAGVALNPGSDIARLGPLRSLVDLVLAMTVNPGFGGQELIEPALARIPRIRDLVGPYTAIEVDGGINRGNIRRAVEAGANWVVTGSALFGAEDVAAEARILQGLMTDGRSV